MNRTLRLIPLCLGLCAAPVAAQTSPPATPAAPPRPPAGASNISPVDQTPIIDFPGQYAPRAPGEKFPVFPKGCSRIEVAADRLACAEYVLADWPRLGRFAAANAALGAPGAGVNRVVFFGDSITDNWSKRGYGGFFPGKPYLNRGIGGQTTAQMLVRFRADVIALKPKAVVILAGTNDLAGNSGPTTPEAIQNNIAGMADLARQAGIRVVLASILPVTDAKKSRDGTPINRTRDRPPEAIRSLNSWMAALARKQGLVYLDYYTALADAEGSLRPEITDDGLHPNMGGYALMAPLAEKAITRALGHAVPAMRTASSAH